MAPIDIAMASESHPLPSESSEHLQGVRLAHSAIDWVRVVGYNSLGHSDETSDAGSSPTASSASEGLVVKREDVDDESAAIGGAKRKEEDVESKDFEMLDINETRPESDDEFGGVPPLGHAIVTNSSASSRPSSGFNTSAEAKPPTHKRSFPNTPHLVEPALKKLDKGARPHQPREYRGGHKIQTRLKTCDRRRPPITISRPSSNATPTTCRSLVLYASMEDVIKAKLPPLNLETELLEDIVMSNLLPSAIKTERLLPLLPPTSALKLPLRLPLHLPKTALKSIDNLHKPPTLQKHPMLLLLAAPPLNPRKESYKHTKPFKKVVRPRAVDFFEGMEPEIRYEWFVIRGWQEGMRLSEFVAGTGVRVGG
ncbi:MAG: hypothetical protein MMC33_007340 [Icmadophila ericetorum]|nr:hypothetical protein [Icmadophila ericetorum]